jgi:L-fuculose-phosphate aldolase
MFVYLDGNFIQNLIMDSLLNTTSMHPRDQITLVMQRIYKRILTTTSGGNLSIIDENGDIWITPTGVDKGLLKPSDIVCMKADGTVIGDHKPSSEYPFHLAIYKSRTDIKAIVHAHPPALVAFSIVRKAPNTNILPQLRFLCGKIGYAPYALPGSAELGENIAEQFRQGFNAVIMENHGTVIGGTNISDAYQKFESMEMTARSILYGNIIGKPAYLSEEKISAHSIQSLPVFLETKTVSYPSTEREKRLEICKIVKRACEQGLMLGAYGTVSARWRGNDFLITPEGASNWDLKLEDIVQIKRGQREKGKFPCRSAYLHQEIYERHPDINAIIITQSPYLTSFAITGAEFNVRTIPETWIYLQNVGMVEFGEQFAGVHKIASIISSEHPVVLVKNECVIVAGNKLLQAFDYLEVAEFSAKSLVMATSLGQMIPISDEQVEDLGKVMSKWKNYEWAM